MKRITALVLALLLLLPCAFAETWDCLCGKTGNTGNFCGKCGRSREEALQAQTQADGPDVEAELLSIRNAGIGDTVTYGHYPQTAEGNDETPIEWLVLDVQGDKALLLSRYGLDTKPYNEKDTIVTWETCTLREWLNGKFLNRAFSAEEQKAIPVTDVDNGESQGYSGWSTEGGNDTQDKVFLLSYAEAHRYLEVEYWEVSGSLGNTKSRVAPTAYAVKNGAIKSDDYRTADGEAAGFWWLRSLGHEPDFVARVSPFGCLYSSYAHDDINAVRPALWIELGQEI